jgi:hypothetical protein
LQRELRPGSVFAADYIENRGVGLPYLFVPNLGGAISGARKGLP